MDKEEVLKRVVLKCNDFVRQLSYHRAMLPHAENLRTNIWIYSYNNYIDMAVLDWCHLFGNNKDDLHWKNNVANEEEFRQHVLESLKISQADWDAYWLSVKGYRDNDVAHIKVNPKSDIPDMDTALEMVKLYYINAINELHERGIYMALPETIDTFTKQTGILAENYIKTNVIDLFEYTEPT